LLRRSLPEVLVDQVAEAGQPPIDVTRNARLEVSLLGLHGLGALDQQSRD
jgi:hypothetical protein